ncbi:MAG: hypothetical protein HYY24_25710 [Verrucomicrobia bacterium]|nr:hypothetical protein [Verrucomicrobiota bacterium]
MSSILNAIFGQAILALVGYGLVAWAVFRALVNSFALRQFRRAVGTGAKDVAEKLMHPDAVSMTWPEITHPAAKVLGRLEGLDSVSERELARLVDFEMDRCFSPLLNAVEKNQVQAQFFGLCGTLTGYPLAAEQFRQSRDVVNAFGAISMAIWTTVVGTVVAQWEDSHARSLNALRQEVIFDTWHLLNSYTRGRHANTPPVEAPASPTETPSEPQRCCEAETATNA